MFQIYDSILTPSWWFGSGLQYLQCISDGDIDHIFRTGILILAKQRLYIDMVCCLRSMALQCTLLAHCNFSALFMSSGHIFKIVIDTPRKLEQNNPNFPVQMARYHLVLGHLRIQWWQCLCPVYTNRTCIEIAATAGRVTSANCILSKYPSSLMSRNLALLNDISLSVFCTDNTHDSLISFIFAW